MTTKVPARVIALGVIVVGSIVICAVAITTGWIDVEALRRMVEEGGATSKATYVVTTFVLEVLWFPRMWGLLVGGLAFGPWPAVGLSFSANMCSASFCYALSRFTASGYVRDLLARKERVREMVDLLARRRGLLTITILRVLPAHYTAVGYAAGLAGVPLWTYLVGTAIGILPASILYSHVGDAARRPSSPFFIAGIAAVGLLVLLGLYLAHRAWRAWRR